VEDVDTIRMLKDILLEYHGFSIESQRFVYEKRELKDDDSTFAAENIKEGATIYMIERFRLS
jgi:hypothetical protein